MKVYCCVAAKEDKQFQPVDVDVFNLPGTTSRCTNIVILDDDNVLNRYSKKTFYVMLTTSDSIVSLENSRTTIDILDDEGLFKIT